MWARLHNILLDIWLMASPGIFPQDYGAGVSTNNRIVGPIVLACAIVALHECLRNLRWLNLAIGIWLLLAPWMLGYHTLPAVNSTLTGLLLLGASTVRGRTWMTFDGGWYALWARGAGPR